jgi:F-box and WD-40 domain protein 1/11
VELEWERLKEKGTSISRPGEWTQEGRWIPTKDKLETRPIHYPTFYRSRRLLDRVVRGNSTKAAPLLNVAEHADSVYCLAVAHPWLVTGGRDKSLQIRHLSIGRTRKVANVEKAHEGSVLSCVVDLDTKGGIIVTGSSDSTAAVWRVSLAVDQAIAANAGQLLVTREQTLRGHTDTVLDVALASHHIITCSKDTTIRIYARDDYTLLHNIITAHTGPVNCLSLHSDSLQFVSASGDGTLVKYDLSTAQELLRVTTTGADGSSTGHGLACIAWSGPYIVTGSNDRDIRIYDTEGTLLRRLEGHTGTVRAVDLDVDEEGRGAVVSGSYDHTVVIWDIETGRIRQRFPNAHESIVLDVHLKNGRLVS